MVLPGVIELTLVHINGGVVAVIEEADVISLESGILKSNLLEDNLHTDKTSHITVSGHLVIGVGVIVSHVYAINVKLILGVIEVSTAVGGSAESEELAVRNGICLITCAGSTNVRKIVGEDCEVIAVEAELLCGAIIHVSENGKTVPKLVVAVCTNKIFCGNIGSLHRG